MNAQRALAQLGKFCSSVAACRTTFPRWQRQFRELVQAWDARPVHNRKGETMTGAGLAGIVQTMLLDAGQAISIPLVVSRAAKGDYRPLNRHVPRGGGWNGQLMYWSIWCNEPWVGLGARGPWGTDFDTYAGAAIAEKLTACSAIPKRAEPRSLWTFPSGRTPVLAIAGGADPQDPISNLPTLRRSFPDSRAIVVPHFGHSFSSAGCLDGIVADFISRGTTKGLRTGCVGALIPPPFELPT